MSADSASASRVGQAVGVELRLVAVEAGDPGVERAPQAQCDTEDAEEAELREEHAE